MDCEVRAEERQAEALEAAGDFAGAVACWRSLRERLPTYFRGYLSGARAHARAGEYCESARILSAWLRGAGHAEASAYAQGAELVAGALRSDLLTEDSFRELTGLLLQQPEQAMGDREKVPVIVVSLMRTLTTWQPQVIAYHRPLWEHVLGVWSELPFQNRIVGFCLGYSTPDTEELAQVVADYHFDTLRHLFNFPKNKHRKNVEALVSLCDEVQGGNRNLSSPNGRTNLYLLVMALDELAQFRHLFGLPGSGRRADLRRTCWPSSPAVNERKLRLAVCVSGQLRGFVKAFRSWQRLGLSEHETRFFVHVWRKIGRKRPTVGVADRAFGAAMAEAYTRYGRTVPATELERAFPRLISAFMGEDEVDEPLLRRTYGPNVAVEDEDSSAFVSWSPHQKMYYKIEEAWKMCHTHGAEFDLVLRMRPDWWVHESSRPDWRELASQCWKKRLIYADHGYKVHPAYGVFVGDQFAVGRPELMEIYCTAYTRAFIEHTLVREYVPRKYTAHAELAFGLLEAEIAVETAPNVKLGELVDPGRVSARTVLERVKADIASRPGLPFDSAFLQAARQDFEAQCGGERGHESE